MQYVLHCIPRQRGLARRAMPRDAAPGILCKLDALMTKVLWLVAFLHAAYTVFLNAQWNHSLVGLVPKDLLLLSAAIMENCVLCCSSTMTIA